MGDGEGGVDGGRRAARRLGDVEAGAQSVPALAILSQVDGLRTGAGDELAWQTLGELQRRLTSEAHDDGDRLLGVDDVQHVLVG